MFYTALGGGGSLGFSAQYRMTIPSTTGNEATTALNGAAIVDPGTFTVDVRCDVASGGAASVSSRNLIVWSVPD
jgi:hypothetical protein